MLKLKRIKVDNSKCQDDKVKIAQELFDIETSISKYAKDNSKFKKIVEKMGLTHDKIFIKSVKKETLELNNELNRITLDEIETAKKELEQEVLTNPERQQDFDKLDAFFKVVGAMK